MWTFTAHKDATFRIVSKYYSATLQYKQNATTEMDDEDVVTCLDDNTIFTKQSLSADPLAAMYYDTPAVVRLAVKCWLCQKDVTPSQLWNWDKQRNGIHMKCCGREDTIFLTDEQIKQSNESGVYWAFLQ